MAVRVGQTGRKTHYIKKPKKPEKSNEANKRNMMKATWFEGPPFDKQGKGVRTSKWRKSKAYPIGKAPVYD